MRRVISIGIAVLIISGFTTAAENRYFYESGKIVAGEEWLNVYVYNDSSVVDMTGGIVNINMESYDASILNISGGNITETVVHDSSILNFSNGYFVQLWSVNEGTANILGGDLINMGTYDTARINLYSGNTSGIAWINGESVFSMYDGTIDRIGVNDASIVNLRGGQITSWLGGGSDSVINIYGHDLIYDPIGGAFDGGQLRGFYLDNTEFTIDLYDIETYSHINLIPEPSSLLLLCFGSLILRRKR